MSKAQSPISRQQRAIQAAGTRVLKRMTLSLSVESISTSPPSVGGMLLLTALHIPSMRGVSVGRNSGAITSTNL